MSSQRYTQGCVLNFSLFDARVEYGVYYALLYFGNLETCRRSLKLQIEMF